MKVLIVRLSSIGDVVQGIPCLVALKESFPDWQISWLVEETSAPILEGHPCLHRLFVVKRKWRTTGRVISGISFGEGFANFKKVLGELRGEHFDAAIDLQGLFKSGLWTWLSHAPRRIGHNRTREFAHLFLNEFVSDRPMFDPSFPLVQRYLEPAKALGANTTHPKYLLPPSSRDTVTHVDALLGSTERRPQWIALCPWSAWPSKNWPESSWKEFLEKLSKHHRVLRIGSSAEVSQVPNLLNTPPPSVMDLVGKTSIAILPEIFRRCRVVVGPDTGPVHLANAVGIPQILMLFGSTSWRRSGPLGLKHKALSANLDCQPCFERRCPLKHQDCLHQLSVREVFETILQWTSVPKTPA